MDTERLGIDIKTAPNYAPSTVRFSNAQITVSTIIVPIASLKPSDVPLHAPSKSATPIVESDILWWLDDIEDGKLYIQVMDQSNDIDCKMGDLLRMSMYYHDAKGVGFTLLLSHVTQAV